MSVIRNIKWKYDEWREMRRSFLFRDRQENIHGCLSSKKLIILSSDCVGGRLMKDYMLPCYTPTVNIWYTGEDFLKICENPCKYFSAKIERGGVDSENHPTGIIDDIVLHFGHEKEFEFGARKWKRGCRLYAEALKGDYEICVIMNDRNGFTPDLVKRFENLPYKYKVLFTHCEYENAPHTFCMKGEEKLEYVKTMTLFENMFSLKRRYDRFDFYRWICEIYQ